MNQMDWTGERMVPEGADPSTFWEHVYRYRFATNFVSGKRVLDIACGEGYGTAALLEAGAANVIGIDISEETCQHARMKYGVDARVGKAEDIPLSDASVDLIVSFETVEHVAQPKLFLSECARVLSPTGRLVVSTPNKEIFRTHGGGSLFHCSEMTRAAFVDLVSQHFRTYSLYGQMLTSTSWLAPFPFKMIASPWNKLPTSIRWRDLVRSRLCPHVHAVPDARDRDATTNLILMHDSPMCALVNPYAVQPLSGSFSLEPVYLIAVAEGARSGHRVDMG
jgi:ubiquinone/menaquinone biosynthesis C-methylase UbiE